MNDIRKENLKWLQNYNKKYKNKYDESISDFDAYPTPFWWS